MKKRIIYSVWCLFSLSLLSNCKKPTESPIVEEQDKISVNSTSGTLLRNPNSGVYGIWTRDRRPGINLYDLPYLKGGQIVYQWKDLNPNLEEYDFSALLNDLQIAFSNNKKVTIQLNGNQKPEWLFDKIPYNKKLVDPDCKWEAQKEEQIGILMYWHPQYITYYKNLITKFAMAIETSPYKSAILGIRVNYNRIGTEGYSVPLCKRPLSNWTVPQGANQGTVYDPNSNVEEMYVNQITEKYINSFSRNVRLFFRHESVDLLSINYNSFLLNGTIGLMQTSSEAEPRDTLNESRYVEIKNKTLPGNALGYAESYSDSYGNHGVIDDLWASPPQWNYWRILSDLNMGISFIAVYGSDLEIALNGDYYRNPTPLTATPGGYKNQFNEAFIFADKYAGYHADPVNSPGTWVAFRKSETAQYSNQALVNLKYDYNFLMRRVSGGVDVKLVGPSWHRFGAWARKLGANSTMTFAVNQNFANSILNKKVTVKVSYLDQGTNSFNINFSGTNTNVILTNSGKWETKFVTVNSTNLGTDPNLSNISLTANNGEVIFHMVEIIRAYHI